MSDPIAVTLTAPQRLRVDLDVGVPIRLVNVGIPGPRGRTGEGGAPGERGLQGLSGASFEFEQMTPQATWVINHNLARFPHVVVVDSAGSVVVGDTQYVSANCITVTFSAAFGGKAYLN